MTEEVKRKLASGDTIEWELFYDRYEAKVKKIITNRVFDKNYVNDLINEVFVIIFDNIHKYCIEYPIENWISKIAVYHCINHHNKQKSKTKQFNNFQYTELEDFNISDFSTVEDKIIYKEKLKDIKNTFKDFTFTEKKILMYRVFEEYKYNEIEDKLNVNISTVKNTIRKYKNKYQFLLN